MRGQGGRARCKNAEFLDTLGVPMQRLLICAALVVATLFVYAQTVAFDFVGLDDGVWITENPAVQSGITPEAVEWAFTTRHEGNWVPLTWLSHLLVFEVWGDDPSGHHAANVLLHALNVPLLFGAFRSMTGETWPSAGVAALFAVHLM